MRAKGGTVALCGLLVWACAAGAQQLPDTVLQQIQAGAARLGFPGDSVALPLFVGDDGPLVEVTVNGHGPFKFLVDLGSNVVLVRRTVLESGKGTILVDRETTDIGLIDVLAAGSARFERVVVGVYDELDVDGVIGYNAMSLSSFTLDYPGKRMSLHRRVLPEPDGRRVHAFRVVARMPYVRFDVGGRSVELNLDSGASEWMTIPPAMVDSLRWSTRPAPGRVTTNNQTGATRVLEGVVAGVLSLGELRVPNPLVYVNPEADEPWVGSAVMRHAAWTFDVRNHRVEVRVSALPGVRLRFQNSTSPPQ